jgi:hypothetical protein
MDIEQRAEAIESAERRRAGRMNIVMRTEEADCAALVYILVAGADYLRVTVGMGMPGTGHAVYGRFLQGMCARASTASPLIVQLLSTS